MFPSAANRPSAWLIYNSAMWFRRVIKAVFALLLFLPMPALLAPYLSPDPLDSAYRIYHPFMYRYPNHTAHLLRNPNAVMLLAQKLRPAQSLCVLALMIKHW